jgi:hypothetical protein
MRTSDFSAPIGAITKHVLRDDAILIPHQKVAQKDLATVRQLQGAMLEARDLDVTVEAAALRENEAAGEAGADQITLRLVFHLAVEQDLRGAQVPRHDTRVAASSKTGIVPSF